MELKGQRGSLTPLRCNVTKEEDIKAMFQQIRTSDTLGCVHVIVNCAGLAHEAPLLSGETSQWRSMLDVMNDRMCCCFFLPLSLLLC